MANIHTLTEIKSKPTVRITDPLQLTKIYYTKYIHEEGQNTYAQNIALELADELAELRAVNDDTIKKMDSITSAPDTKLNTCLYLPDYLEPIDKSNQLFKNIINNRLNKHGNGK